MRTRLILPVAAVVLVACGQEAPAPATESPAEPAATVEVDSAIYADAIAVTTRLEGDYEKDESRKPDQVLEFFGIERGDHVLDLYSGGGYYSEIVSHVVGSEGRVVAHLNEPYLNFVGDEYNARHAAGRLPNVEVLMAENNELQLGADTYDAILMVLTYHDIFYDGDGSEDTWVMLDGEQLLAELYEGLKPGGIVGVVDHRAAAGSPRETGNTLHRIDPGAVIEDFQNAGFVLDGSSDILRNDADDHSILVFNPDVRGKTDRFILRFRKSG